jgi:hypothetical protein
MSSSTTALLTVVYTLYINYSSNSTSAITYYGFGSSQPSPITTTGSPITMSATAATDAYSSNGTAFQNYYQTTTHNVTLQINSTKFSPSNSINQLGLVQTQLLIGGSANITSTSTLISFYYDTVLTNPVINSFISSISAGTFTCISGIYILSTSMSFNATTSINSGIGNYFYNPTRILAYSVKIGSSGSSITASTETSLSKASSSSVLYVGPQSSIIYPITFINGSVIGTIASTSYGTIIYVGVTAYNVVDTSYAIYAPQIAYNVIIDQPSYNLIYNKTSTTTNPSIIPSASGGLAGYKIYSGAISNNGTNGLPDLSVARISFRTNTYDHTQNISSVGNYDQDLQLCNGAYSTYGSTSNTFSVGYQNYLVGAYYSSLTVNTAQPNYSGISNTVGSYRWSTYVWKCPIKASGNSSIVFNINGLVSNGSLIANANILNVTNQPTFQSKNIKVYYRFEDAFNTVLGAGLNNTAWINATSLINPIATTNFYILTYEITGQSNNQSSAVFTGGALPINCTPPSFTIASADTIYLYCAIGLDMSTNIGFSYVTANLS